MASIDIFYQGEHIREIEHIEIDDCSSVATVKMMILEKHGGEAALLVFEEDNDEALDEAIVIATLGCFAGLKLHLHRCREVEVTVTFAGQTVHHAFRPG